MIASRSTAPIAELGAAERVFYCIGAQKAGTTWLYATLKDHPEVHLSRIKEVHYWDTVFHPHLPYYAAKAERAVAEAEGAPLPLRAARALVPSRARAVADARRYRRMFREPDARHGPYQSYLMAEWSGEPVVGDISPGYAMMRAEAFAAMDAVSEDARFILVLRDPVARLWSNMRHNRSRGLGRQRSDPDIDTAFRRHIDDPEGGPFLRSDYRRTIRELEAAVPRERIAYFFYETLFQEAEMARLAAFLGIAPIRADLARRVNPSAEPGSLPNPDLHAMARARLAPVYAFAAEKFAGALPAAWHAPDAA